MLLKTYPAMFPHIYVKHKELFFLLYVKYILYIYIIYINKNFVLASALGRSRAQASSRAVKRAYSIYMFGYGRVKFEKHKEFC